MEARKIGMGGELLTGCVVELVVLPLPGPEACGVAAKLAVTAA